MAVAVSVASSPAVKVDEGVGVAAGDRVSVARGVGVSTRDCEGTAVSVAARLSEAVKVTVTVRLGVGPGSVGVRVKAPVRVRDWGAEKVGTCTTSRLEPTRRSPGATSQKQRAARGMYVHGMRKIHK